MRTTVTLPDGLSRRARKAALERSCTLSESVEEALLRALSATGRPPKTGPTKLVTYGGHGVRPGVDLDSGADLLDRMEGR